MCVSLWMREGLVRAAVNIKMLDLFWVDNCMAISWSAGLYLLFMSALTAATHHSTHTTCTADRSVQKTTGGQKVVRHCSDCAVRSILLPSHPASCPPAEGRNPRCLCPIPCQSPSLRRP